MVKFAMPSIDIVAIRAMLLLLGCAFLIARAEASTIVDTNPPSVRQVTGSDTFSNIVITFSEPVAPSSVVTNNFSVNGGLTILSAALRDPSTVLLATSRQTTGAVYTVTIRDIRDRADPPNLINPNPTVVSFTAFVLQRGFALHKFWQIRAEPATIDRLLRDPRFPSNPDFTTYEPMFEYPQNGQGEAGAANYANQLTAFLIPPLTGEYVFYCNADEVADVFLSASSDPAEKTLICRETQPHNPRQWLATDRRPGAPEGPENRSSPIPLQAGKLYYLEVLHADGDLASPGSGDNVGVSWQIPGGKPPANGSPPIPGNYLATYVNPANASVTITQQPQNVVVIEGTSGMFTVGAQGSGTLSYQWQQAAASGPFADIIGASRASYTTPPLFASDNGARYRVLVSVPGASTVSAEATVTIESDRAGPLLLFARRAFSDPTKVLVGFSEPISAASGGSSTNFQINNGITVVSSQVSSANSNSVELVTSPIAGGTTNILTVNNVEDLFGNRVATNSQVLIEFEKGILFVTGNPPLTGGDSFLTNHLVARGFAVETLRGLDSSAASATGKDLIILSSTVSEGEVSNKFTAVAVPLLTWNAALQDDLRLTGDIETIEWGTIDDQMTLEITNPAHPMAAGFARGILPVLTTPQTFSWGQPAFSAQLVAQVPGDPGRIVIYGYEKQALMAGGFGAPARRVMFFLSDDAATVLNGNGVTLFDAAVDWALNITTNRGGPTNDLRFTAITVETNSVVTLTWTGGTPPYLLQSVASLSSSNWFDLLTTTNQTAKVLTMGEMSFYRVSDHATNQLTLLSARLNGTNARPPVVTGGFGTGLLSLTGTQLNYQVSYSGLSSAAIGAHLHGPATTNEVAAILAGLGAPTGRVGQLTGRISLTQTQLNSLLNGRVYVDVHTINHTNGEIRGQVGP